MPTISFWERESFFAPQDVIIVGSGFSGLWSALHLRLLNPDHKITILEKEIIPTGASTRNAGFSCFGSPSELIADATLSGETAMWQLVKMRYQGLAAIREFFSDESIDYSPCGGYECFTNDTLSWLDCSNKLNWINKGLEAITGDPAVFSTVDDELLEFGFRRFQHLIKNKLEGTLDPGKLVKALLQKVQAMGVQVLTGIDVTGYTNTGQSVEVFTSLATIQAKQLLICTNAFTQKLLPTVDILPTRGQVFITTQIPQLKMKGAFHFDEGYYYFRNVGNRLLIGGARNKSFSTEYTTSMETTELIQEALQDFVKFYLLPGTPFTIADSWAGTMAMGSEKKPIVQEIERNVFCCVRMSGMGVALAPVVAKEVAMLMKKN